MATQPPLTITILPASVELKAGDSQAFRALGEDGKELIGVSWSVINGGETHLPHGVYTAPARILAPRTVTVVAEHGTPAARASATVLLDPVRHWIPLLGVYWFLVTGILLTVLGLRWSWLCPSCAAPSLLVSPPVLTLSAGGAHAFTANTNVTWTNTATAGGLYVAPATVSGEQTVTVTATSVSEPKLSSSALVRLSDAGSFSIQPAHATVKAGTKVKLAAVGVPPDQVEWLAPVNGGEYLVPEDAPGGPVTVLACASVTPQGGGTARSLLAGAHISVIPSRRGGCDCPPPCAAPWRLIAMAALLGALGGLVHGLGSFGTFVGNREFKSSWVWWYFLKPFLAAVVAVLVFLIFRAGLGTPDLGLSAWDCLKVAAFAGLVGLFADPATLKLKDVFETLFTPRDDPRRDKAGKKDGVAAARPVVTGAKVEGGASGGRKVVRILGEGFASGCAVMVDGTAATVTSNSPTELKVELAKPLDQSATFRVVVYNKPPAGEGSEERTFKVE